MEHFEYSSDHAVLVALATEGSGEAAEEVYLNVTLFSCKERLDKLVLFSLQYRRDR